MNWLQKYDELVHMQKGIAMWQAKEVPNNFVMLRCHDTIQGFVFKEFHTLYGATSIKYIM